MCRWTNVFIFYGPQKIEYLVGRNISPMVPSLKFLAARAMAKNMAHCAPLPTELRGYADIYCHPVLNLRYLYAYGPIHDDVDITCDMLIPPAISIFANVIWSSDVAYEQANESAPFVPVEKDVCGGENSECYLPVHLCTRAMADGLFTKICDGVVIIYIRPYVRVRYFCPQFFVTQPSNKK